MRTARRLGVTALVFALAATACSKSEESASTTAAGVPRSATTAATVEVPTPVVPTFAGDAELIGVDDAVRIGVLDNGLTYYIRENDSPGARAQLRLAVHAGSVQEVDDQRGAAHYLEHMMFNGTDRFPANELILLLQRFVKIPIPISC